MFDELLRKGLILVSDDKLFHCQIPSIRAWCVAESGGPLHLTAARGHPELVVERERSNEPNGKDIGGHRCTWLPRRTGRRQHGSCWNAGAILWPRIGKARCHCGTPERVAGLPICLSRRNGEPEGTWNLLPNWTTTLPSTSEPKRICHWARPCSSGQASRSLAGQFATFERMQGRDLPTIAGQIARLGGATITVGRTSSGPRQFPCSRERAP